jgi:hypothetical protein
MCVASAVTFVLGAVAGVAFAGSDRRVDSRVEPAAN